MQNRLDAGDHERITGAIRAAEARTSGEIYCVVSRRSSDYGLVPVAWASIASLLVPALIVLLGLEPHRWAPIGEPWSTGAATTDEVDAAVRAGMWALLMAQALAFAVVLAVTMPERIRLAVTPPGLKRDRVHRAAMQQFLARGMQRTRDRTGVLIFVSLAERLIEVIADEGIYAKVAPTIWDEAVSALAGAARRDRIAEGLVTAVGLCGAVLAEHFPPRQDDFNELPDRVVEL
jgi:putative membrane protein